MKLVECVPNFSEGRRPEVVAAIRDAIAAVAGVAVLDVSSDPSHNRTVITFVVARRARGRRRVRRHRSGPRADRPHRHTGEHPRIGATDVVPFIPLEGTTMDDCVALARTLGERVGTRTRDPRLSLRARRHAPRRENLADVRRGEFEGLRDEIGTERAESRPRLRPERRSTRRPAPPRSARGRFSSHTTSTSARRRTSRVAKEVAKAVRGSSGGLRYVKGLGLEVDGQAQVSMNLVDTEKTPL